MSHIPHSDELHTLLYSFPKWLLPAGIIISCLILIFAYIFPSHIKYQNEISLSANITSETDSLITGYFDITQEDIGKIKSYTVLKVFSEDTTCYIPIEPHDSISLFHNVTRIHFSAKNNSLTHKSGFFKTRYSVSIMGDTLSLYDKIIESL